MFKKNNGRKTINRIGDYPDYYRTIGAPMESNILSLPTGVSLRVTRFSPDQPDHLPPVVFLPGMLSGIENFQRVMYEFTRNFVVYFVETREKKSGICKSDAEYTIESMAADIKEVIALLGMKEKQYILLGYSMGASVIVEAFSLLENKPSILVTIVPNTEFRFPAWSLWLASFIAPFFGIIKPFLKQYIRFFHVNTKEDPEMHRIQMRVLDGADPRKLCATIRAIAPYKIWDRLDAIDVPMLVIGASKDSLHTHDDSLHMASMVKTSTYIDLETNERNHGGEVVEIIRKRVSISVQN
jgi:pimeloyl-ACP methyl ester carboxylesterase